MPALIAVAAAIVGVLLGGLVVYLAKHRLAGRKLAEAEHKAQEIITAATAKQKELLLEAKEDAGDAIFNM